jgi:hypothetical protein
MVDADLDESKSPLKKDNTKKRERKEKKEKKNRKRTGKELDEDIVEVDHSEEEQKGASEEEPGVVEKDDKKKKDKKRQREAGSNDVDGDSKEVKTSGNEKEDKKAERKKARQTKLTQQAELMDKVPKLDDDGLTYTKHQTRRMLKRVKRGLPPVPTQAEEQERMRNEAQLRREEEAELAGEIDESDDEKEETDNEQGDADAEKEENDEAGMDEGEKEEEGMEESEDREEPPAPPVKETPSKKKAKRSKLVPDDYVCSACKNKHKPTHWIYDCPDKVTMKGTNQKKKKFRGLHDPDSKKVFVSGLPFDVKAKDILDLFQSSGKVVSHKLVTFKDTGRCNGQAYVTFDTEAEATKALKVSGTTIGNISEDGSKKKKKSSDSSKRKELKLKVSKVLNRHMTKGTTV